MDYSQVVAEGVESSENACGECMVEFLGEVLTAEKISFLQELRHFLHTPVPHLSHTKGDG
jgi:hypothetical protein